MITDHWVSANLHFHREGVGSSWNAGVVLGADQPSGGKAHLEEKQSMMGLECGKITDVLKEREDQCGEVKRLGKNKSELEPQLYHLFATRDLLESFLIFLNFNVLSIKQALKYLPQQFSCIKME